jgi:AraC family transcriptional regulator, regulatory protein of adaptative response / methylated-DNA-[protein]-cysteine methyltransferase
MSTQQSTYYQASFETPLGLMIALADEKALYFLAFADCQEDLQLFRRKTVARILTTTSPLLNALEAELHCYFEGSLQAFKTPLCFLGSPFQQRVWQELQSIPFGKTQSYSDIAIALGKPSAFRAVAQANSTNPITLIIPCHRIINKNNTLGGYSGGTARKQWLINHEKQNNRTFLTL